MIGRKMVLQGLFQLGYGFSDRRRQADTTRECGGMMADLRRRFNEFIQSFPAARADRKHRDAQFFFQLFCVGMDMLFFGFVA